MRSLAESTKIVWEKLVVCTQLISKSDILQDPETAVSTSRPQII
jgi:hypothetical protein